MLELLLNALTLFSILVLVALGLAIVFGLMNIINMAHGEFVMIGAFTLSLVQSAGGGFWAGVAAACVVGAVLGLLLERLMIRHLYERPMAAILATFGVSLILQHGMQLAFGAAPRMVTGPVAGAVGILGTSYPAYRLLLIASAIVIVGGAILVMRRTAFGLDLRTVIQNREVAELVGIDTSRIFLSRFAPGTGARGGRRRAGSAAGQGRHHHGSELPRPLVLRGDRRRRRQPARRGCRQRAGGWAADDPRLRDPRHLLAGPRPHRLGRDRPLPTARPGPS